MIDFVYNVTFQTRNVFTLQNIIHAGVEESMDAVVEVIAKNIRAHIDDADIAQTIVTDVRHTGRGTSFDEYHVIGSVYSTWPDFYWYEHGRPPGGKMPPSDRIIKWIKKHGLRIDPQKALKAFAFAANRNRTQTTRSIHNAPALMTGWVPIEILVDRVTKKGITPTEDFAYKSMAYAIGLKIVKTGIPGHHAFQQGLDESMPMIHQSFEHVVLRTTGL